MKSATLRSVCSTFLAAWLATSPAFATCGGGGGGGMGGIAPPGSTQPQVYYVPWQVVGKATAIPSGSLLVVYWFPRSRDEARASELVNSRLLTNYSAQCVAMALVPSEDRELHQRYEVAADANAVLLVSGDEVVERIDNATKVRSVEKSLTDVVKKLEQDLESRLDEAKAIAEKGEKEKAVELYASVADQKCLHPKPARTARKALEKLGVTQTGSLEEHPFPKLDENTNARMVALMTKGLVAEEAAEYEHAKALYSEARALDPGDAVPLRFLGELERHHTGEWDAAKRHFGEILDMSADSISVAVALHGLGKMTIHDGDFAKGLSMFEQSVSTYPLALTFRNLAVYWNSEGEREKAMGFVRQALALDPDDPYNLVFAATYLAEDGKYTEAIAVATKHEGLMPASYNLAAIYALSGEHEKALALLRRHFYEYERYDDVRRREMWEARADIVFESLKTDPEFVELTGLAD